MLKYYPHQKMEEPKEQENKKSDTKDQLKKVAPSNENDSQHDQASSHR